METSITSSNQSIRFKFPTRELAKTSISIFDLMGRMLVYYTNKSGKEVTIPVNRSGLVVVKMNNCKGSYSDVVMLS